MFGYFLHISAKRSSQNGMVWMMPFDLVAEVTCFFLVVEAKSSGNGPELAAALEPYLARVRVISFDEEVLRAVGRRAPTTFLFAGEQRIETVADTLGPWEGIVTAELVRTARVAGLRVVPWTVNDPARMRELTALGVDGLTTDEPATAVALSRARP
jgi:glycerophosphoryl diester phosphodiesterase